MSTKVSNCVVTSPQVHGLRLRAVQNEEYRSRNASLSEIVYLSADHARSTFMARVASMRFYSTVKITARSWLVPNTATATADVRSGQLKGRSQQVRSEALRIGPPCKPTRVLCNFRRLEESIVTWRNLFFYCLNFERHYA